VCRKDLLSADARSRRIAVVKLGWLGPDAAPALPELKQVLQSPENNPLDVLDTLVRIGPKAEPILVDAVRDKNPHSRWPAANALLRLRPGAQLAILALAE